MPMAMTRLRTNIVRRRHDEPWSFAYTPICHGVPPSGNRKRAKEVSLGREGIMSGPDTDRAGTHGFLHTAVSTSKR